MSVTVPGSLFTGEHVLAIHPAMSFPTVDAGWRRRLVPFTGRALDETAFQTEQAHRAGRLALLGQTVSPGIVHGLETDLAMLGERFLVTIAPGMGLAATGEDVVLGHPLQIDVAELAPGEARVGIVVAVPVSVRRTGRFDPRDPCERDDTADAYADELWIDGVEIRLLAWEDSWGPLPEPLTRNAFAYAVFERERAMTPLEVHPWATRGVPLAAIAFAEGRPQWLDAHAVARIGGKARSRTPLFGNAVLRRGTPFLWQARIDQLTEHLGDLLAAASSVGPELLADIRWMPPVGVLPPDAIELPALANRMLPDRWELRFAPIAIEQLDGVVRRCASLAPLSTQADEQVLVLVPVPQAVYEPRLLETEVVDPAIQATIDGLVESRDLWRARRESVRGLYAALATAIEGEPPKFPPRDPDALEDEPDVTPEPDGTETYGVASPSSGGLVVTALLELEAHLDEVKVLHETAERPKLRTLGLSRFIDFLAQRIDRIDDVINLGFLRAQTDIYRMRQHVLGSTMASRLAISPALAGIAKGESAAAVRADIDRFYQQIKSSKPTAARPPTAAAPPPPAPVPPPEPPIDLTSLHAIRLATDARDRFVERVSGTHVVESSVATELVTGSEPVIGMPPPLRTVTVAERLEQAPAEESRGYAVENRAFAIKQLASMASEMNLASVKLYYAEERTANGRTLLMPESTTLGERLAELDEFLFKDVGVSPQDEAKNFSDAVSVIEFTIGTLRSTEARVAAYRDVLERCRATLAKLAPQLERTRARLGILDATVAELRHRIATARSLLAEERARVEQINARRAAVIEQYVRFLAYARPRTMDAVVAAPHVPIESGAFDLPVPACLGAHGEPPDEIEQMVALVREAPIAWLRHVPPLLSQLDQIEILYGTLVAAKARAATLVAKRAATTARAERSWGWRWLVEPGLDRFEQAIVRTGRAQYEVVSARRKQVAALEVGQLAGRSWQETREHAREVVSIGDLLEVHHGRSKVAEAASRELENLAAIAGCLHAQLSEVVPAIRLAWAETLSQYDRAVNLRSLAGLPRWSEVPYRERRELQSLVDWLYQRMDPAQTAALDWMHDLVRVCILLASHAPVNEIISGHVPAPTTVRPGATISVAIDLSKVKLGMKVLLFRGHEVVAHGLVEDLVAGQARARIAEAIQDSIQLEQNARVQFVVSGKVPVLGG